VAKRVIKDAVPMDGRKRKHLNDATPVDEDTRMNDYEREIGELYCDLSRYLPSEGDETPLRRIIRNYNARYGKDEDFRRSFDEEVDLARISHQELGMIYEQSSIECLKYPSAACCPTYGNCACCLRAGPLGKDCPKCTRQYYCVVYTGLGRDNMIDAERLHYHIGHTDLIEKPSPHRTFNWKIGDHPSLNMKATHLLQAVLNVEMEGAGGKSPLDRKVSFRVSYEKTELLMNQL